jgi:magnesium-transporting ATPase (P-type)
MELEPTDTTTTTGDYNVEEAHDAVAVSLPARHTARVKIHSDMTGMTTADNRYLGDAFHAKHRDARRKTRSDLSSLVLANNLPAHHHHQRQKSSADVLTKFGTAPVLSYDDLKLADSIATYGTRSERQASGISDKDFADKIGEKEDYISSVAFNLQGLSSSEADELFQKYGRNELPESVNPLWLVFLRQFWAPMPTMIWVRCCMLL